MNQKELETIVSSVEFDQASASLSKEDLSVLEDNSNGTQHSSFSSLAMPPCHAGGKDTREHSVSKVWQRLELGVLVAAILVVWGLLSLPVVFYHLPIDVSCVQNCLQLVAAYTHMLPSQTCITVRLGPGV